VARDRKRAKQRRQRQAPDRASAAPPSQPIRADLPGSLDHASGEVDEFDAALVRGAGATNPDAVGEQSDPVGAEELDLQSDDAQSQLASSDVSVSSPRQSVGRRAGAFLRASWAELQRVQWPDRRQVSQATAVVLGFVVIAGAYLGAADWVAQKIINFIL
jgi:preprotein translocase subunit SecE